MQTFSVEVVNVELWPIEWKQCAVIQASLFQFLSNILVYKNHHVYLLFCKVLLVIFETSSAILSMSKGPLVIRIVHGRTSYEVFLLTLPSPSVPLPPPPAFQEHHESFFSLILFHGMQTDSFGFFLLTSIIVHRKIALNSLYFYTRKSIHCIFCVSQS